MSALTLHPLGSEVVWEDGDEPGSWTADAAAGYFVGESCTVALVGARSIVLLQPFTFVEGPAGQKGRRWEAKIGARGDGSSIPGPLQRILGSPLVGLHRFASVLHDVACVRKEQPWRDVHRMYYLACRAAGERLAWLLGQGVKWGGPRW